MVIVDTGFWVALFNKNDKFHTKSIKALQKANEPLMTTWPVLTETFYFLLKRDGLTCIEDLFYYYREEILLIFSLSDKHVLRIEELIKKYRNLPMDLADASLVIVAEEYNENRILTTDVKDFSIYKWKGKKSFENLLV
jgi:predicted nucleic acid-binding protein